MPDADFPRVYESAALREKVGVIMWRDLRNALGSSKEVFLPVAFLAIAW